MLKFNNINLIILSTSLVWMVWKLNSYNIYLSASITGMLYVDYCNQKKQAELSSDKVKNWFRFIINMFGFGDLFDLFVNICGY